jgi:exopolysaccharide biosynthesis polyprenyl glycosylphosphotransferase
VTADATLRRLLVVADAIAVLLAFACTVAPAWSPVEYLWLSALTLPVWLLIFQAYGLYDRDVRRIGHSSVADLPPVFHSMLLGGVLFWLYTRVAPLGHVRFTHLIAFAVVATLMIVNLRSIARRAARHLTGPERVLLVGGGQSVGLLVRKMRAHPEYGVEPVALAGSRSEASDLGVGFVADPATLELGRMVDEHRIGRVVISPEGVGGARLRDLLRDANRLAIKVSVMSQPHDAIGASVEIDDLEGVTLFGVCPPTPSVVARVVKRGLDLAGATVLLVVLSPVMIGIAAAVRISSGGPSLFRQQRIGKDGRPFRVLKFRTMVDGAAGMVAELQGASRDPHWLLIDDDPRVTRVGRVLRRTSLDELPQLWNVVRGEMSLVGPRPLIEDEDRHVTGWGRRRGDVTPGLTGLWQVLGRTAIPFEEMVNLDYLYVANWSLWRDIQLLLRTVPAVVGRRGAN